MTFESDKYREAHSVVVVELDAPSNLRKPGKPHLHITSTSLQPKEFFENLVGRYTKSKLPGKPVKLRQDLACHYKPSRSKDAIKRRIEETKLLLSRLGHAINGDASVWSIYVLDVDPDSPTPLLDRGKRNHVVYVGQTSSSREKRLAQHQGIELSKSGKYIGSPRLKDRKLTPNIGLTPLKVFFTKEDAIVFETRTHKKLEALGYRVLGDVRKASGRED